MQKILDWLSKNAVNNLISLLFFVCGLILGVLVVGIVLRFLKNGKVKTRKKTTVSIESFVDGVAEDYLLESVKLGEEKLSQLLSVACKLFEEIPKYYNKNVKFFEVLKAKDFKFLQKDVKICFNFSVYEGLRFLRATIDALQEEIYLVLDHGVVKGIYGVGKIVNFFTKTIKAPKNIDDFLISDAFEIVDKFTNPNKKIEKEIKGKEKNLIKKGLKKVGEKVGDVANSAFSKTLDNYVQDFIRKFAQILNLLYSDGFKEEKTTCDMQSTSKKEIA